MTDARILVGDCREQLANIADNSIDAIITDPPYELGFMGKTWDNSGVAYDIATWAECLRVLKPGGHLCAFGGTRTYHRMTVAIEDAGFEIRDSIHWIYGSGFPKSLDVSKAIDKAAGAEREIIGSREVWGRGVNRLADIGHDVAVDGDTTIDVTAPATDAARQWDGWGTALKPAHEPIVLARKPLIGTVAQNVLEHGTGALNIDATRIGDEIVQLNSYSGRGPFGESQIGNQYEQKFQSGRWPANILITHAHDCTPTTCAPDCPAAILDAQSGTLTSGVNPTRRGADTTLSAYGTFTGQADVRPQRGTDTGGASRFFTQTRWDQDADLASFRYVAKPSRRERNAGLDHLQAVPKKQSSGEWADGNFTSEPMQNTHPTVKPVALMRWLIRLVTPPGGTILDPFLGSGTTAVAATLEGHPWTGCELTDDYLPIIEGRVAWAERNNDTAAPVVPTNDTTTSTTTTTPLTFFGDIA